MSDGISYVLGQRILGWRRSVRRRRLVTDRGRGDILGQRVNALKRGAPLSFNHAALSSCCTFGQGSGWNVLNGFLSFSVILSSSALRTDGRLHTRLYQSLS